MRCRLLSLLLATLFVGVAAAASAQTPGPPVHFHASTVADSTTLHWTPPSASTGGVPTGYIVQVGTTSGGSDVLNQQVGNVTSYELGALAPGTYFLRVRALNASGVSAPSDELVLTLACTPPSSAPANVTWRTSTSALQATWTPVPGAGDYRVEVGTAPGLSDVAVVTAGSGIRTFATAALPAPGTYYIRVRATRACGAGPASPELTITASPPLPSTTVVVNEFGSFVELKNISSAPIAVGGWRIHTANGADQVVARAATLPAGVTIAAGCTFLLAVAGDPLTAGMTVDQPLTQSIVDGVAVVRSDGMIVDAAGRFSSFDAASPHTPYLEGTALTARRDSTGIQSFARAGDQDTNNNAADFVPLATANPQNAAACLASQPPGAPSNLTVIVNGATVALSWTAPSGGGTVSLYRLEAGTAAGLSNVGAFDFAGDITTVTFGDVPSGTYFVRVRAVNSAGVSAASNEAVILVCAAGCNTPPGPVTGLTAQVSGRNVLLQWTRPASGPSPNGYVIEAGTAPGLSDLGQFPTGSASEFVIVAGVPPGTYYVRVRAANGSTLGAPSNEVIVLVQ
jgi:hypothetical protein